MANEQVRPAQATVVVRPQTPPAPVVLNPPALEEDDDEIDENVKSAAIEPPKRPVATVAKKKDDPDKLVKIRPRQSLGRIFVGGTWYHLSANKDCLVPTHVKRLLEEKGVI